MTREADDVGPWLLGVVPEFLRGPCIYSIRRGGRSVSVPSAVSLGRRGGPKGGGPSVFEILAGCRRSAEGGPIVMPSDDV